MKTLRIEDIPAEATARQFLQALNLPQDGLLIEEGGEPRLMLVAPEEYRQRREAKQRLFAVIDRIRQRHPDGDSDELLGELDAQGRSGPGTP